MRERWGRGKEGGRGNEGGRNRYKVCRIAVTTRLRTRSQQGACLPSFFIVARPLALTHKRPFLFFSPIPSFYLFHRLLSVSPTLSVCIFTSSSFFLLPTLFHSQREFPSASHTPAPPLAKETSSQQKHCKPFRLTLKALDTDMHSTHFLILF